MNKKFLRQCACWREYKSKEELIRITKDHKTGEIVINNDNIATGRSIYVCKNKQCVQNILKKKRIESSLKAVIPDDIREILPTVLPD